MVATRTTAGTPAEVRLGGRDSAPVIRDHLRTEILSGRLHPGAEISQTGVAADLGVSRGPVREAFRLLERDGLIDTRVNYRARIASLSVDDLEHLYTLRVLNESLALSVSTPLFTPDELDELDFLAAHLRGPEIDEFDFEAWDLLHQRFHGLLLVHSGARMIASAAEWAARTQRYRRTYAEDVGGLPAGAAEHAALARLCRDRDADGAARLLARHLSRAALVLLDQMAPEHDPVLLRGAIRQVTGPDDEAEA
jgi:DNA-binding GntR family transcriptional regulator